MAATLSIAVAAGLDSVCLTAAPWEPLAGGVDQSAGGAGPQRSVAVPVTISSGPSQGEGGEEREKGAGHLSLVSSRTLCFQFQLITPRGP